MTLPHKIWTRVFTFWMRIQIRVVKWNLRRLTEKFEGIVDKVNRYE